MDRRYSRIVKRHKQDSLEFVSSQFDGLDYDRYSCEVVVHEEEARGKRFLATILLLRILLYILVGILAGFAGAIMEIAVHFGSTIRYSLLSKSVNEHFRKNTKYFYITWITSVFVPAILGHAFVSLGEPRAAGGGVNWCLGYLNGINLNSTYMTLRVLFVKLLSCILCVVSSLPGGKEAPLIHIGSIIGCQIPLLKLSGFQPFEYFEQDPERRDLTAGGSGAGLCSAFTTPIAGIMLSFEEGISYWNVELTFLIFLSTISSFISLKFITTAVIHNCPECIATNEHFFLDIMNTGGNSYMICEIGVFILIGTMGGLLGALWNKLQRQLIIIRKKLLTSSFKRFCEILLFIICCGLYQASMCYWFSNHCLEKDSKKYYLQEITQNEVQLNCKDGEIPTVSLLLLQDPVHVLRSIFTENNGLIGYKVLLVFWVFYYFGSCLLCGMWISHGIFTPHLLSGALWGRFIAEVFIHHWPQTASWVNPNKWAYLCCAAQLSGSLHITYTISVMMLECTNNTHLAIPLFIACCFSKAVSSLFGESIYHVQCGASGLPILMTEAPPMNESIQVRNMMSTPVQTLPLKPTYHDVIKLLSGSTHNGFPVVASQNVSKEDGLMTFGSLKGLIPRPHLVAILNLRLTENSLSNPKELKRIRKAFYTSTTLNKDVEQLENEIADLEPFMNASPFVIKSDASLPQAYRLFALLGLRHLVVVNDSLQVVGIITRSDLSVYRYHSRCLKAESIILPLR